MPRTMLANLMPKKTRASLLRRKRNDLSDERNIVTVIVYYIDEELTK